MSYDEFVGAVKKEVTKLGGRNMRVELHTAIKNNGKERIGLALKEEQINVSPAIYLDEYFDMWQSGKSIDDIAKSILQLYEKIRVNKSWEVSEYHKYQSIKPKLACKLINLQKNKKLLLDTPYIKYLDLAIVFYLLIDVSEQGTSTMLVKDVHKEAWEVSLEEMYQDALLNVEHILPSCFQTMHSVINELITDEIYMDGYEEREYAQEEERMYVLSNTARNFGAACILYKEKLNTIGKLLEENFYILPSSIHEVIIVPVSKAPDRREMDSMIKEINGTQVLEEEVLSDHVYFYNQQKGMLLY